jgi:hypothetical protein
MANPSPMAFVRDGSAPGRQPCNWHGPITLELSGGSVIKGDLFPVTHNRQSPKPSSDRDFQRRSIEPSHHLRSPSEASSAYFRTRCNDRELVKGQCCVEATLKSATTIQSVSQQWQRVEKSRLASTPSHRTSRRQANRALRHLNLSGRLES